MLVETNKIDNEQLNRPLLEVKGLRIEGLSEKGWQEIVRGVNLELKRGEILGLIGESGAGKSTIGLAAMGFARDGCRSTAGEIIFDGIELSSAPENESENSVEPEFLTLPKAQLPHLIQRTDCSTNLPKDR